jgi:alkylation response protein AidB-like acyl-CoA dehydrogenase
MTVTAVDVPSKEELVERAEALKPLLLRNAPEADETRRIPEESIVALTEAGLFKVMVPRRFGGYEVPFDTTLAVSAKLGEACGSTSWVVTLTNVCAWLGGLYCDQTQQEIWGSNPDARICGVLAPTSETRREDGGLRVTGRWGYASGSLHADWALLGVPVVNEAGEQVDQGLAMIPMSDLTIEDTWFVPA